jgi:hypothetical protein
VALEGHKDSLWEGSRHLVARDDEGQDNGSAYVAHWHKKKYVLGPEANWKEAETGGAVAVSTSTPSRTRKSSIFSKSKPGKRRLRRASHCASLCSRCSVWPRGVRV